MEHESIIQFVLFAAVFLFGTSLLQVVSRKTSFPYTIALLLLGFAAQVIVHLFLPHFTLTLEPDIIFYILLPLLLFEAAMHINIHEFKIQFKTISFLATFGLMVSVFLIALGLLVTIGLSFGDALLFGAIISATDPIAVLALFKTLGAPKRLALLADGESMFNDATAVIAFRIISAFVVADQAFSTTKLLGGLGSFLYVFSGSIIFGVLLGIAAGVLFARVKQDRILIAALTTGLAIGSFIAAEHFFALSGVIACVITGIAFGNVIRTKLPVRATHFLEEFWGYFSFLAVSLVFFFASFNLNLEIFGQGLTTFAIVIAIVLVARATSVYLSSFLSNRLSFFKDEPGVPTRWQHILNWGGLRGVIPLVLVYSLPDTYVYKELMLQFTMATLLFTLLINGLTIKWLLTRLGLHLPSKEEIIIKDEAAIFANEEAQARLRKLDKREFDTKILSGIEKDLKVKEAEFKNELKKLSSYDEFQKSLRLEALDIERQTLRRLYAEERVPESMYYTFESELDLQQDTIEYPEVYPVRALDEEGHLVSIRTYRKKIFSLRKFAAEHTVLSSLLNVNSKDLIKDRYSLLRARIFTSYAALDYLDRVEKIMGKNGLRKAILEVKKIQKAYVKANEEEARKIEKRYAKIVREYQTSVINSLVFSPSNSHSHF